MYERENILERLVGIQNALERIPRRFSTIKIAEDFEKNEDGRDRLDAICMSLIAIGEAFKQIDAKTEGDFLRKYPDVEWRGVIGVRNVIAHGYFDIDVEQVFDICKKDIPAIIVTVRQMIDDLHNS
jgi:uncharacterized protein with HEPN domain